MVARVGPDSAACEAQWLDVLEARARRSGEHETRLETYIQSATDYHNTPAAAIGRPKVANVDQRALT